MPSNSRTAKTIPPIIAAAKAHIADLKQLYRAAAYEQAFAETRRSAGRQPASSPARKSAKTSRKL